MSNRWRPRSVRSLNALADNFDPSSSSHHAKLSSSLLGENELSPIPSWHSSRRHSPRTRHANNNLTLQASLQANGGAGLASTTPFDPFAAVSAPLSAATAVCPVSANPYSHDAAAGLGGATFFASHGGFQPPVRHLFPALSLSHLFIILTFCRLNIICTHQLGLIVKICWATSETCMIFFFQMTSEKSSKRRRQPPCRSCPVRL